jgi:hypothetical protein
MRDAEGTAGKYQLSGVAAGHRRIRGLRVCCEHDGEEPEPNRQSKGLLALRILCYQAPSMTLLFVVFLLRRARILGRPCASHSPHRAEGRRALA